MARPTRFTLSWVWGFLLPALLLLASGSRPLAELEGRLLAFTSRFVAPVAQREPVAVIALTAEPTEEEFPALMKRLETARAIGLVPPFPRTILNTAPVSTPALVVQGAMRRSAAWAPPGIPAGMTVLEGLHWSTEPPYDAFPGLLTGSTPSLRRAEMDLVPLFPSDAAVLDLEPGLQPIYRTPLIARGMDAALPGFALRLATLATGENIGRDALARSGVLTSDGLIPTDGGYRAYPRPMSNDVQVVPAAKVLAGEFDARDKVVLVGLVNNAAVEPVVIAGGAVEPPVVAEARITAALMGRALYAVPYWVVWAQIGLALVMGAILAWLLPRLRSVTGLMLTLLILFVGIAAELAALVLAATFVPLTSSLLALVVGNLLLLWHRRGQARLRAVTGQLTAANLLLGQAYQSQGQLDAALERYRACPADDEQRERLYQLGLDFERRRQFARAADCFAAIGESDPAFRDSAERRRRNVEADGGAVFGKLTPAGPGGTVIMSDPVLTRPVLGRYEVERELGRGAMGAVYLGRDPRIGRTVAIKTMALSHEFADDQLEAVRARFFREAETAGRLAHPNIVTIYDVGEEHDLAYIAMDYLKGDSLARFCKQDELLPVDEVLAVAAQVADALDYAHGQNVVHRDIKPANMIYDRETGIVKVTDFGVARLTDDSRTRTGTVLGSPSYMSPEQVAGHRVDGRTDLYSLGVTLFQLLSGDLPFKGDSLASLMYRIANDKPADIRRVRRDLPPCVGRIIGKALQKDPERRYATGGAMAAELRRCGTGDAGVKATRAAQRARE